LNFGGASALFGFSVEIREEELLAMKEVSHAPSLPLKRSVGVKFGTKI
jgi:hypothetical protein